MKKKLYIIILLMIVALILTITFFYNKHNKANMANDLNEKEISIRTSDFNIGVEKKKIVINDITEIKNIENIIHNLDFSKETCDGLSYYILTINDNEEYGIEIYPNGYHITDKSKGEARLTEEQTNTIKELISKYF